MDTARSLISYIPVRGRQRTKSTNTPGHFLKVSSVLKKINQGSELDSDSGADGTLNGWSEMTCGFGFRRQEGARHVKV